VKGRFDLERQTIESVRVEANGIDLAECVDGGKPSRLSVTATASASDLSLEGLTGALEASGRWQTPDGAELARVALDVAAKAGALTVHAARAVVPGASASLSGRASATALALTGTLEATDLSRLDRTLVEFTGTRPPTLGGAGTLSVSLSGPLRRPRLTAQGTLSKLRVATLSTSSVDLDLTVPDVSAPLDASARLVARELSVSGRQLDELRADVGTHGRELSLTLATKGLGDLTLTAGGTLEADGTGLALASLRLDDATSVWALEAPTHLRWSPGLELDPLVVASKGQRLEVRGRLRRDVVDAALTVTDLDLGRLPQVLVPRSLGLAGRVSGTASATGRLPRPDGAAAVRAQDVSVKGVTGITGALDGTFVADQAKGTLALVSSLGAFDATFDVPLTAVMGDGPAPLAVTASFHDVSLEAVQSWLAQTWPITGTLAGRVSLQGPASDPGLSLAIESPLVTVTPTGRLQKSVRLEALVLGATSGDDGRLTFTGTTRAQGAAVRASVETPLSVRSLRRAWPSLDQARGLPLTATAEVADLSLDVLHPLGVPGLDGVTGRATLSASLSGSLDDPRGLLRLTWKGVEAPPLEDLDGALELTLSDTLTRLAGSGRLSQRPLFELEAFVDAPLQRLQAIDTLGAEQVSARLSLAPMPLGRFLPRRDDDVVATGSVSVDLGVKGTLNDPTVSLDATVQNLSFGKVPLGQARLVSRTQGQAQTVSMTLKAAGNSELRATGRIGLDPSITLLRSGLDVATVPVDLALTASAFDLGFLSGVTPMVRTVGGQLDLERFRVTGTLGAADVSGTVSWHRGRLALASFGDFRDIDVDVGVTNERLDVKTLSVRSGSGSLVLDPSSAQRQASGAWRVRSSATAARFSVVTDDQLMAIVSAKVKLEGDVTPTLVDLSSVELGRVDVELPEVKRKDVQDLERPDDLVLVRGGRVVAGRRRADTPVATGSPARTWRAQLVAPRNLWVRSTDLNVELGLSDGFRVEYADTTQLFGEAQVLGGRIDVIGREFKVNRIAPGGQRAESTVRFTGPATQPLVNVRAEHTNEREKVKVVVSATGRGKDVTIKVSSDPPMSESDIYTLLATGRRDLRRSSGTSITAEQAVSVVGSLAANELKNALLKKLPIDIVDVVSIDTGSEGLASTRVEVGKYLSDSLYLGYTFQPGANKARGENTHAGRLELQVSKNVCLEATAGDAPAAGADVVWSRDW
jgi:translocation and assembly module TamB